jgi:hypothetical protein
VTVDELETGLSAIAAPVEGREGVICAIGVSGPTARLQDRVDQIGRLLTQQADALSALLGRPGRTSRSVSATLHETHPRTHSRTKEGVA